MKNSEKIQILKENIVNYIKNLRSVDENHIFNFAKLQAKEMRIEITKGEIKSIINNIISSLHVQANNIDYFEHELSYDLNQFQSFNEFKNPFNDLL